MDSRKATLQRAGTMDMTAQDGRDFLERNVTDWKKPYLIGQIDAKEDVCADADGTENGSEASPSKPSLAKHTTMVNTAKEAEDILNSTGGKPDPDAQTRGQQRKIDEISEEKENDDETSPKKKPRLSREGTIDQTAGESKHILGDEKYGDTRSETAGIRNKTPIKRDTTIAQTVGEAKVIFGDDIGETGKESRRKSKEGGSSESPLKRQSTMDVTAKEGEEFLNRKGNDSN